MIANTLLTTSIKSQSEYQCPRECQGGANIKTSKYINACEYIKTSEYQDQRISSARANNIRKMSKRYKNSAGFTKLDG